VEIDLNPPSRELPAAHVKPEPPEPHPQPRPDENQSEEVQPSPVEPGLRRVEANAEPVCKKMVQRRTSHRPAKFGRLLGMSDVPPTHMLLYLNRETFVGETGEKLADEVRLALSAGTRVAMIHENDEAKSGCPFYVFFQTTPPDLISSGLYKSLAIAFMGSEAHREVSRALFAKVLGATRQRHTVWQWLRMKRLQIARITTI